MLKVKIVNTKDLYYEDEERAINSAINELRRNDAVILKIVYRQNSVIIEYLENEIASTYESTPSSVCEPSAPVCVNTNVKPLEQ